MAFNPPPPNPQFVAARPGHDNVSHQPAQSNVPVLSRDEIRVLKECNRESYYYRCIPLSVLLSGLVYIGVKNGYLKKSPRFGVYPKMAAGAIVGYIGGKFSYQSACAEKIMRLPNSSLAEAIRKRKGLPSLQESASNEPGYTFEAPLDSQRGQLTLDERRPDLSEHEEGIDSYNTVKESLSPYAENEEAWKQQKLTSYDDLRSENRREYYKKSQDKYRSSSPDRSSSSTPPSFPGEFSFSDSSNNSPRPESRPSLRQDPNFNPKKNKYGDVWDD